MIHVCLDHCISPDWSSSQIGCQYWDWYKFQSSTNSSSDRSDQSIDFQSASLISHVLKSIVFQLENQIVSHLGFLITSIFGSVLCWIIYVGAENISNISNTFFAHSVKLDKKFSHISSFFSLIWSAVNLLSWGILFCS